MKCRSLPKDKHLIAAMKGHWFIEVGSGAGSRDIARNETYLVIESIQVLCSALTPFMLQESKGKHSQLSC